MMGSAQDEKGVLAYWDVLVRRRWAVPAGGDPVRCYQQLARWISLDGWARKSSVHVFHFVQPSGRSIQKSMNELIALINAGKCGDKTKVWARIGAYMRKHRIPMKVVKQPVT